MPCYHPLPAWFSRHVNPTGKRSIVFNVRDAATDQKVELPCGRCLGCRLERSRQWAMRCMHEAKTHEDNLFVTLTYDDEHLPLTEQGLPTLNVRDFQLFMKRLREKYDHPIRFFQCGEYGEKTKRPHHHALLFGHRFSDMRLLNRASASGARLYSSESLDKLWGLGFCTIGEVNFESASYVARYAMKKVYGPAAAEWYAGRLPEYLTMSRRPGIGSNFFDRYNQEIYQRDSCIVNGKEVKPPKYYDQKMHLLEPETMLSIKDARKLASSKNPNNKPARLRVRERTATHKFNLLQETRKL